MERGMYMTDHQFDSIIDMVDMILDGCKDLAEARRKIKSLRRENEGRESSENKGIQNNYNNSES